MSKFQWILLSRWEIFSKENYKPHQVEDYWKWYENVWKILEKIVSNLKKFKLMKIWWIFSIGHRNVRKLLTKFCEFRPKFKKKIQENFEIFWSKSLWKIGFFHNFLLHIYWISASSPKVYTPLEAYFDTARACLGVAAWGSGGGSPGGWRNFQKGFLKYQWKITILGQFYIILMKIFLKKFWRNFEKNLKVRIYRGFGSRAPLSPKLTILLKNSQ